MELNKFQESLLVFSAMKTNIENNLRVFKRYIDDEDLKFAMSNKMLIDISSFLEEWKRFNTYAMNSAEIRETMKITAPAIKRLKSWKGLEGMRNTMLAHGFRDRNEQDKPTRLEKRYFSSDVPTTYAEVMLLSEYCVYVIAAFFCRHKEDHRLALQSIQKNNICPIRGIQTNREFEDDVQTLQEHMFRMDESLKQCFGF